MRASNLVKILTVTLAGAILLRASPAGADSTNRDHVAVLVGARRSYRAAAVAMQSGLHQMGYKCTLVDLPEDAGAATQAAAMRRLSELRPTVVVAGGSSATVLTLSEVPHAPVVFFMVPNALDASFMKLSGVDTGYLAGVTTDIEPGELVAWIQKLHPAGRRVAAFYSARSARTAQAIGAAAGSRGITVVLINASKDSFPEAIDRLNEAECDSVLMIPDAQVFNAASVKRLLLWGVRQKKPVWGFSENVIKAGALAGQYSSPEDIGRQTAELVDDLLRGQSVASIGLRYPRSVSRAVNEHIAKMIDLSLPRHRVDATVQRFGAD